MEEKPRSPAQRSETPRQRIRELLEADSYTVKELSRLASVAEHDVAGHLEHLRRTLKREGGRLEATPAACIGCGFLFTKRDRATRPGRCPACKGERIEPASFRISL